VRKGASCLAWRRRREKILSASAAYSPGGRKSHALAYLIRKEDLSEDGTAAGIYLCLFSTTPPREVASLYTSGLLLPHWKMCSCHRGSEKEEEGMCEEGGGEVKKGRKSLAFLPSVTLSCCLALSGNGRMEGVASKFS